jgi:hypothetical protein
MAATGSSALARIAAELTALQAATWTLEFSRYYTTCMVHRLDRVSSRNLLVLKGEYKSYVGQKLNIPKTNFYYCMKKFSSH